MQKEQCVCRFNVGTETSLYSNMKEVFELIKVAPCDIKLPQNSEIKIYVETKTENKGMEYEAFNAMHRCDGFIGKPSTSKL